MVKYGPIHDSECDALPAADSETTSTQITLTDRFGKMNKCKQEAVIRFRKYNKDAEPNIWYRAKLMLYYPWYDEHADLLGIGIQPMKSTIDMCMMCVEMNASIPRLILKTYK